MDHFIVWHTHPSGNIGPSKGDMDSKIQGFQYLVVTMPSGEATLF
jgi:proteasome lid subunit RPN8/RPN11